MFSIRKHDGSTDNLTLKELVERKESEIQANTIHKEIISGVKIILIVSLIMLIVLLINYLFKGVN